MERKPQEDLAALLAKSDLLGALTNEWALWLAQRVPDASFGRGQLVYRPRYKSRVIFVVLEGRVRLYKMVGGAEITLEIIEAGHLFGDVPALAGRQQGTYAEALEATRVGMLSLQVLEHLVHEEPEIGLRWAELLAERLYEYRERMADVSLKKVPARLASLILRLIEWEGVVTPEGIAIRTPYTHEQLATMIGSKRVAVSRAMSELRKSHAVEVKGRRIYLEDEETLRRSAGE